MTDLITEIWTGLNDAGMPEVMLYLPDGSACRCHWDDTALVGTVRVSDTNSVVPAFPLRLAAVAVELVVDVEVDWAVLSWSSAAVRFCSAWSSESCAEVESSVASS